MLKKRTSVEHLFAWLELKASVGASELLQAPYLISVSLNSCVVMVEKAADAHKVIVNVQRSARSQIKHFW